MTSNSSEIERQVVEIVGFYRGFILDSCEQLLGSTDAWPHFRKRLLKLFGDHGLEGKLRAAVTGRPIHGSESNS